MNWCQQVSTGHLHVNGFESTEKPKKKPHQMVWFLFLLLVYTLDVAQSPVGLDMHFVLSQREDKIIVVTSVCTGHRNCPPDSSM